MVSLKARTRFSRRRYPAAPNSGSSRIRRRQQLTLEALEDRVTPNTYTWTGATANNWSSTSNWLNGQRPINDVNADIIFPTNGRLDSLDDIPTITPFRSMRFDRASYTISSPAGFSVRWYPGSITSNVAGFTTLAMDLDLRDNFPFVGHTFSISGFLRVRSMSGSLLSQVIKNGGGFRRCPMAPAANTAAH